VLGICFAYESRALIRNEWAHLIDWFAVDHSWEYGKPDKVDGYPKSIGISTAAELPEAALVVLSPPDARIIPGTIPLPEFTHPEDAIYFFGANNVIMGESPVLSGREYQTVFIPSEKLEYFAAYAATATLYDRKAKQWAQ